MCGIAGFLYLDDDIRPREALTSQVRRMAESLTHRGPDGRDTWVSPSGRCALGHARLKVIDLDTGDQPMTNEDGSVVVTFNGEIYNFEALRRELSAAGHRFKTRSDTEVLVHGYEAWGDRFVERLDGMFAFGLWDERRGRLILGRDRVGKKPLFVYRDAKRLAFGSEMKAFHQLPDFDDRLSIDFVPLYLAYGYVPTPGTPYRAVQKLPPATVRVIDEGGQRDRRYWRPRFTSGVRENPERTVRTLLTEAVERRLVSDVPLGAFLSGGIDSTLIVALMSAARSEPVDTFSIGFADDPTYDETAHARAVSKRFGTRHHEFRVEAGALDLLDPLLDAYDEPFGDSSAIPTYTVSQLTREHVTVALTGDGGDEMFAGYPRFLGSVLADRVPRPLVTMGGRLARLLPHNSNFRSPTRRITRFLEAASLPPEERMLRWIGFWTKDLDGLLTPAVKERMPQLDVAASFREAWRGAGSESSLSKVLSLNFDTYLLDDLLVKADRCSMAHGLELRSPFLDIELIEFAQGLPDRWRIRGKELKTLLRRAFSDLLPPEIVRRPKMGFGVPLPTWFRTHWRGPAEDLLLSPGARILQWVQPGPIRAAFSAHQTGQADHGHAIWALLVLERWLRRGCFTSPLD